MQWYYSKGGTQLGPVSESDLKSKAASGEISGSDLVWKEGMADWLPLEKVSEFQTAPPLAGMASASSPYTPPATQAPVSSALPDGQKIPTYLWQAIVVTFLCCLPFGIPAIVFAAKVDGLQARGDIPGAMAASKSAKTWCIVSFCSGIAFLILYIIGMVFMGMNGAAMPR